MPEVVGPNKAIAAGGSITLSGSIVALGLYYLGAGEATPPLIVLAWNTFISAVVAMAAVYLTPHGGGQ